MLYKDNEVQFRWSGKGASAYDLAGVSYTITELFIPEGQDPEHRNFVGRKQEWVGGDGTFSFPAGQVASAKAADWWKNHFKPSDSTFGKNPQELNLAIVGEMKFDVVKGGATKTYTMKDVGIAQGNFGPFNNWWFAVKGASPVHDGHEIVARGEAGRLEELNFTIQCGGLLSLSLIDLRVIWETW